MGEWLQGPALVELQTVQGFWGKHKSDNKKPTWTENGDAQMHINIWKCHAKATWIQRLH